MRLTAGKSAALSAMGIFLLVAAAPEILIVPYFAFQGTKMTSVEKSMSTDFASVNAAWIDTNYAAMRGLLSAEYGGIRPILENLYQTTGYRRRGIEEMNTAAAAVLKGGNPNSYEKLMQMIAVRGATASVEFDMKFMPRDLKFEQAKASISARLLTPLDFLKNVYRQSRICWTKGAERAYFCEQGPTN